MLRCFCFNFLEISWFFQGSVLGRFFHGFSMVWPSSHFLGFWQFPGDEAKCFEVRLISPELVTLVKKTRQRVFCLNCVGSFVT